MEDDKKYKILFVCLGNICRSPAAEGIMKRVVERAGVGDNFVIDSAGTGDYHIGELPDYRMRRAGQRNGYIFDHRCRQVCDDDFRRFDLIIGMDGANIRNLQRMAPDSESRAKIHEMGEYIRLTEGRCDCVPDPYYSDDSAFDAVIRLLEIGTENLLASLA